MPFVRREAVRRYRSWWPVLWTALMVSVGLRVPLPPYGLDATGPVSMFQTVWALLLWASLTLLGAALGRKVLQGLQVPLDTTQERLIWAIPTGLLLLSYPVYALGLAHLLRRSWIALELVILTWVLRRDIQAVIREIPETLRSAWDGWWTLPALGRWGLGFMLTLMLGAFLLALTPPDAYDALWYHLQAPRLFLQAGRIYPEWHNWPANYAFGASMLYVQPLALGSDTAPKLLHWTLSLTFLGVAYYLARTYTESWAWLAPAFVLAMVAFPIRIAPSALADGASACLELMSLGALMRFAQTHSRRWLWGAGLWAGLAVGTKFASLPVVAVGVLFLVLRRFRGGRTLEWRTWVTEVAQFVLWALPFALPWYAKNAVWFGTPLFPQGIPSPSPEVQFQAFLLSTYTIRAASLQERLWNIYRLIADPLYLDYIGSPTLALPLMLFWPLLTFPGFALQSVALGFLRFGLWLVGPPRIRFLLSSFALWGTTHAALVARNRRAVLRMRRWVTAFLVYGQFGLLALSTIVMPFWLERTKPWRVAIGAESRMQYLFRTSEGYGGWMFMRSYLQPDDRVFLVGDVRHYYCPSQCYPEADQFAWTRLVWQGHEDLNQVLHLLRSMGITHLWINYGSVEWLEEHDSTGWMARSYDFLEKAVLPECGQVVYEDEDGRLIRLTCLLDEARP